MEPDIRDMLFPNHGLIDLSSLLGWTLAGAYLLFWLFMLVDCVRRKDFYPVWGSSRRTRVFWLLTFLFFNPLMTLMYLLFGRLLRPQPKAAWPASAAIIGSVLLLALPQLWPSGSHSPQTLRFQRDPVSGEMKLRSGVSEGLGLKAETIASTNSQNSVISTLGNDESIFACEYVLVLGLSKHPLMQQVAGLLCKRIGSMPCVQSVAYYPPGESTPAGGRAPDLVVVLDAPKLSEIDLRTYRELTCSIDVSGGAVPWEAGHHFTSDETPPLLCVAYSARLEHRSRIAGLSLGEARYQSAAESIVEQIEGNFLKSLGEWSAKCTSPTGLPASFYGEYAELTGPLTANHQHWQRVLSGSGIFNHNRTIWRFEDDRTAEEVLDELESQLTVEGFKTSHRRPADDDPYLRMCKAEQEFEFYRLRRTGFCPPDSEPAGPSSMVGVYHLRFTQAERCRAIEDLLSSAISVEQLLAFRHSAHGCPDGLAERLLGRIVELPATSARALLAAAEWHHSRKQEEEARASLRSAVALAWVDGTKSEMQSQLKDLGRKLALEDVAESQPDESDLLKTGLPRLPADGEDLECDLVVGKPLRTWLISRSGELYVIRCAVVQDLKTGESFSLSITIARGGSSMTSTVGMSRAKGSGPMEWLGTHSAGDKGIHVVATASSKDGKRFAVTARISKDTTSRPE